MVDSFDGDPLMYYPLDKGYYTETTGQRATLSRNSDGTYTVKDKDGFTYHYKGYKTAWREKEPDAGKLESITDRLGNAMEFAYDDNGGLNKIIDTAGREIKIVVQDGLIRTLSDPLDRTITYQYDDNDNLSKINLPDGSEESFAYDANHRLTLYTDTEGRTYNYQYDNNVRVHKITRQNGPELKSFTYVADGDGGHTTVHAVLDSAGQGSGHSRWRSQCGTRPRADCRSCSFGSSWHCTNVIHRLPGSWSSGRGVLRAKPGSSEIGIGWQRCSSHF